MAITLTKKNVKALPGALVRPGELGEEGDLGEPVFLKTDGKWYVGRANAAATTHTRGIIVSVNDLSGGQVGPIGKVVDICVFGPITGYSGMDEGVTVWQGSAAAGALTQTQPSGAGTWSHHIGWAEKSDILFVAPSGGNPVSNT